MTATATIERPAKPGRAKDRDFDTVTEFHEKYAEFINMYSDLQEEITPGLVKAAILLKTDFLKSDLWAAQLDKRRVELAEKKAERERKAAEKAAREARYANLTEAQKKAAQKAERLAKAAAKARQEFDESLTV